MKVTVCIPTFNYGHLIGEAIGSVLAQGYQDFELLILDNASEDHTGETVGAFEDGRIRYFRHDRNVGFTRNLNAGLRMARGEYVVYLSADDCWMPTLLEREVRWLDDRPDVVFVHTGWRSVVRENGRDVIRRDFVTWPAGVSAGRAVIRRFFVSDALLVWPMVRRRVLQDLGGFNEQLRMSPDSDMWLRAALTGNVAFVPEPLAAYRWHGNNLGAELQKQGVIFSELVLFVRSFLDYVKVRDEQLFRELHREAMKYAFRGSYHWLLHARLFMDAPYLQTLERAVKIVSGDPAQLAASRNALRLALALLPVAPVRALIRAKSKLDREQVV